MMTLTCMWQTVIVMNMLTFPASSLQAWWRTTFVWGNPISLLPITNDKKDGQQRSRA